MRLTAYRNFGRLWQVYGRSAARYATPKKVINALRTEAAYRQRRADVRSAPYLLFVEPLYYCNLECPLCDRQVFPDARSGPGEAGRLPLDVFDRVLDELGDYLFQVQIFGLGEPMMDWPRTRQIIERSHRRGIFTLVSTNSTLTTPAVAEEVVASGLDYIVCAIDGVSQASYQTYRVGGEVEQALDGMRLLVEERRRQRSRLTIEWQFLVHKHNEHEFDEARRIADQLGVFLRFSPLRGMEFHDDLQREWLPSAPEYAVAHQHTGDVVNDFACYFLWRSMVLSSSGTLVRCPIYENTSPYATVLEGSMLDGFNGASTRRARELFARGPVAEGEFPSPCATCSFFERHHGGPNLDKFGSVGRGNKPAETGLIPVDAIQRRTRQNALRRERSSS